MKRCAVALLSLTLLAAGCSSGAVKESEPSVFAPSTQPPAPQTARLGDTLDLMRIGDGAIAVTVIRIVNPATLTYAAARDPGKNYLAVELRIKNTGTTTIVGNANSDVTVIGSDEQTYTRDFATVNECQNFLYGWFLLALDASSTGCVTFALPPGVSVAKVKYSPSSGISHDVGEWVKA